MQSLKKQPLISASSLNLEQLGETNPDLAKRLSIFAPMVIIGLVSAFVLSKSLNALLLGESYARSMGLNIRRTRLWIIAHGVRVFEWNLPRLRTELEGLGFAGS